MLNEDVVDIVDNISDYRVDYNLSSKLLVTVHLTLFLSCLLLVTPQTVFTERFFCHSVYICTFCCSSSGVDHPEHKQDHFRFHLTSFHSHLKRVCKVSHVTGPFPVSPVPAPAGEVAHQYRL